MIEVCINIRADDVTTWLSVLRRELWPAVRDHAYELGSPTGEVMLGNDKKVPWSRIRFGKETCNCQRQKRGLFVSDEQHIRITNLGLDELILK